MQSLKDPNVDSDLYIIPNPYGPGTTVIRRPHPPPTTTALDEDFDAITMECTTVLGPIIEQGESRAASRGADAVSRRETFHADSKEYGGFGWPMGGAESALSDLSLGIGRARSGSLKSISGRDGHDMGPGRIRQNIGEERDSRRDSELSDGERREGGKSSKRDDRSGGSGRGIESSKIGTIYEYVGQRPGGAAGTWRVSVAKGGDQRTQISYEDSCEDDTATELGPEPHSRRGLLNEDPKQRKGEGRSGEGSNSKGTHFQPSVGDGHSIAIRGKKPGQPRSISNPAYTRSERIYSAADLNVPHSPSECAPPDIGSPQDHPKKRKNSQNQPRNSSSNINSPKASSTSSLDNILSSFQPSLLHIAPVLASLGIRDEEHMRAVGRLSDETRDREVKEVALKEGVTVVEWAMLVDRIRSLEE